jgi:WD40 repeat protein
MFGVQSNQHAAQAEQNALQADQNAQAAINAQATAVSNEHAAQQAEAEAIRQQRLTLSRELAGNAIINLDVDPERSILLAMQAVNTTFEVDGTTTKEASEALHRAVLNSRLRFTMYPDPGDGYGLALSPDGKQIVTSGSNGEIKVWDLASRTELFTLTGHEGHIYALAFSPAEGGSYLASASGDGTAKIWDLDTRQIILDLRGHMDEIFSIDFSQDGDRIVTASIDGTARVWDAINGQLLLTFTGHEAPVLWAQFNPDGTRIATAGEDVTVRVWDAASGQELYTLSDFLIFGTGAAFSPDGKILATNGGEDPKLWDAETGELLFLLPGFKSGSAQGPVFTPDGKYVAVAGQDGTVSMWDTATGLQYLTFATGTPIDGQIEFSPDCVEPPAASYTWCGLYLVTDNRDGSVRFWDVSPTGDREVINLPGLWNCLANDGATLHTASREGVGIAQFHTRQLPLVSSAVEPSHPLSIALQELSSYSVEFSGPVVHLAFSPDCSRSALVDLVTLVVTITDTANGKPLLQFKLAEGTPFFAAFGASSFNPDATRFAMIGPENTARVYDLTNGGQELLILQGHSAPLLTTNFSPDGKQLATTSQDTTARLWDGETGQLLHTFTQHTGPTTRVIFNPEGTRLATGSFDRTVKVWDLKTGEELYTLSGPSASVWGIAFSPDGKLIATGSNDLTLRLWDAMTGEELLTLPIPGNSLQLFFTPDQTRLVVQTPSSGTHVYLSQIEDLLALAKSRVSRTLTTEECQKYLHVEECPTMP